MKKSGLLARVEAKTGKERELPAFHDPAHRWQRISDRCLQAPT